MNERGLTEDISGYTDPENCAGQINAKARRLSKVRVLIYIEYWVREYEDLDKLVNTLFLKII